jgi:hypothetical protein
LALEDVSLILQVSLSTAVALLEAHGFHRPVELIRLDPERRRQKLGAIARQVQTQVGMPSSRDMLAREVVASQRLAGVDARAWVPTGAD